MRPTLSAVIVIHLINIRRVLLLTDCRYRLSFASALRFPLSFSLLLLVSFFFTGFQCHAHKVLSRAGRLDIRRYPVLSLSYTHRTHQQAPLPRQETFPSRLVRYPTAPLIFPQLVYHLMLSCSLRRAVSGSARVRDRF